MAPTQAASRKAPTKKAARRTQGEPKYRDLKSGRAWTGVGRAPQWIAAAKDREALRIDVGGAQEKPEAARLGTAPARKGGQATDKTGAKAAAGKTAARKAIARKAAPAQSIAAKKRPAARKQAAALATQDAPAATPPVPEPRLDPSAAAAAAAAAAGADGAATA